MLAAAAGHATVCKLLVNAKANLTASIGGLNARDLAEINHHPETLAVLVHAMRGRRQRRIYTGAGFEC